MALVLRLDKGTALTNEELDNNFLELDGDIASIRAGLTTLEDVTIPELVLDYNAKIGAKQPLNSTLTELSGHSSDGLLTFVNGEFISRGLVAGSANIVITNPNGVSGDPVIDIANTVVTTTGNQVLSNKTISGENNTFQNISVDSLTGTLPFEKGGTNATTATEARTNLDAVKRPSGNGIIVKTGADASVSRAIEVSGVGLSITNNDGVSGNPVVSSNATSNNTVSTLVARDSSGNFSANRITANLTGNVTGNADTVTAGVYTNQSYNNPIWLIGLAGSKVTNIPNSSLTNNSITINGTEVALGGTYTFDDGVSTNTSNRVVRRDGSGNFAAGTITAALNGNAATATAAQTSITAQRLATPRTINGVSFDGSANITVVDNTKLPLTGGSLSNFLTLHATPTNSMHAATKGYVDSVSLSTTYGTLILATASSTGDVLPPSGKTMSNLAGFLPAMGSSYLSTPQYTTNLFIIIDTSGSASSDATYNGVSYSNAYDAAAAAGKFLVNHYSALGTTNVCLIRQSNGNTGVYKWASSAQALIDLNTPTSFAGTTGTVLSAFAAKPSTTAQTVSYFLSDANHDVTVGGAFGGSESSWKFFLNTNKIVSYAVCVDNSGTSSFLNKVSWDGRTNTELNGFRALADNDLPTTYSPGLYNTGSIAWTALSDRIRITLTEDSDVNNVAINWLALWN